ncbi:DUF11 domain-containing protein [Phenylobacterium sp. J367]|uniref:DUF11 domain-containing protein n=1 Tax=Phenylobacterium sp. J367 TaxID=2898435 RepID=UPI002150A37B|nr:DUF11 domain-containing protein [Phenylobacterium sp. J367]MCR5879654.1 DUF11 domain-containing protein [Phenylobacterium sp. J367]
MPGGPTAYSSSGTTFLYFKLPASGGTFSNCASATTGSNPTTPRDPNPANNTNICVRITVKGTGGGGPPDVSVGKECKLGANRSVTCAIKVTNNGTVPTVAPLVLTDTLSNVVAGTVYTGASGNVACPGAGPYAAPISCTIVSPIPGGQSITVYLSFTVKGKGTFQNSAKVTQGGAVAETNVANNTSNVKVTMP